MNIIIDGDPQASSTVFEYRYHDDASLIEHRTNPNGSLVHRAYDIHGRLSSIATRNGLGTDLDRHAYTYNKAGLRKDQTLLDNTVRDYDYDARRQLVDADAGTGYQFTYGYDAIGNRLSADENGSATSYTPDALNQYDAITGHSAPAYDANGSLTSLGGTTYVWDEENRLEQVYSGGRVTTSTYNGLSRRIKRVDQYPSDPTETIFYVYDGNLPVLEIAQGGGKLRSYTRGLDLTQSLEGAGGVGSLLAMTIHDASIGTVGSYTYGYDGNGNVTVLLDGSDAVVAAYEYDPFGNVLSSGGTLAGANPYQFSTKEYEADWGLNYYLYRFYSPELGRFVNRDPIGEQGGVNLYAFVNNNPMSRWDYLGLKDCCGGKPKPSSHKCCGDAKKGKSYHPRSLCCITDKGKKKVVSKRPKVTGVKKCSARIRGDNPAGITHRWIEFGGGGGGFFPKNGNVLYDDGIVSDEGYSRRNDKSCSDVKLSLCNYDHEKFQSCISRAIAPRQCGNYSLVLGDGVRPGDNCWTWVSSAIRNCKNQAKR